MVLLWSFFQILRWKRNPKGSHQKLNLQMENWISRPRRFSTRNWDSNESCQVDAIAGTNTINLNIQFWGSRPSRSTGTMCLVHPSLTSWFRVQTFSSSWTCLPPLCSQRLPTGSVRHEEWDIPLFVFLWKLFPIIIISRWVGEHQCWVSVVGTNEQVSN